MSNGAGSSGDHKLPWTPPPINPDDPNSIVASLHLLLQRVDDMRREIRSIHKELGEVRSAQQELPFALERDCAARHMREADAIDVERKRIAAVYQRLGELHEVEIVVKGVNGKGGLIDKVEAAEVEIKKHAGNWGKLIGFMAASALTGAGAAVGVMKLFG